MGDGRQNKVDARIGKTNTVLRELYRSVVKKGSFQTPQSCQFLSRSFFRDICEEFTEGYFATKCALVTFVKA